MGSAQVGSLRMASIGRHIYMYTGVKTVETTAYGNSNCFEVKVCTKVQL